MKLSVIIPAYNEVDRIVTTLESTHTYLEQQDYQSEVVVVSDGSTDGTGSVVKSFGSGKKVSFYLLEYHPNRGKGYAVRYGMVRAHGKIVMFMDADYSVPMEEVQKGFHLLDDGFDIAIGSRAIRGSVISSHQNPFRELSAKIYTFIQNRYLGLPHKDTQCGFKLFTDRAARNLFAMQKLDSVIFDPEILWLAKKNLYRVAEFPVKWFHVADSRIKYDSLGKSLFVFQELFRIKHLHP
ncbi:dolichyl-phosphate beta-glucosyltransferase [Thermodesulfobacteriota bacterium]